ncbi:hypothetical protein HMPREF9372_3229 [Sporosarcina newyorkensis 2681]|uniref:Uncharacterized protein n=1 Tax=Sporosarcina newyorkensis 2681 TaxID=1027292 RepID=F9DWP8_9BACL|nr:hypothetical protein HMPREF9372_3229 [Sporosarcina newyorkensis 2681]
MDLLLNLLRILTGSAVRHIHISSEFLKSEKFHYILNKYN